VADRVAAHNDLLRRPRREAFARYVLATEEAYPSWGESEPAQKKAASRIAVVAAKADLEPAVLERWVKAFYHYREGPPVEGDGANPSVVFEIWDAFAAAPPERYEEVTASLRSMISSEKVLVAPLTRSLVRGPTPKTLEEVAWRYASLFAMIEIAWEQHLGRLGLKGEDELTGTDFVLPREQEEIRRLIYDGRLCLLCLAQEEEEKLYTVEEVAELDELRTVVAELEALAPPEPPYAMAAQEGEIVDLPIHIRGSHLNLANTPVPRGFLELTDHLVPPPTIPAEASGRLELARWLTHPDHPLTPRVIVNRVWRWHFGRGIVDTPSNFGTTGSEPTHPELLDWLARRLVEGGWSIKDLHRDIMLSSTYQLANDYDAANAAIDEQNRFHWRMNRRRLEVEPIRDTLLQLAGRLDLTMGGRVEEYDPHGYVFAEGSTFGKFDFYTAPRRSVYMPVVRNAIYKVFAGFDFGDASDSVGDRPSTVVPPQALLMMNSPFVEEQARGFAEQLLTSDAVTTEERIDTAFLRAHGRPATAIEIADSVAFLELMRSEAPSGEEETFAWTRLCQVIVSTSEFLYIG